MPDSRSPVKETIAIIGGTGSMGTGLAYRFLKAGRCVRLGSRSAERARSAASALAARLEGANVTGAANSEAASAAGVIVITVPYEHHSATLQEIRANVQGKLVVDATVPLRPPKVGRVQLPASGAAALEAQEILGADVQVASAFQNVGAAHLNGDGPIECDVLVSADNAAIRERVIALVEEAGMRGWHAGPLANSAAAEALTSVLIQINRQYHYRGAGIRIFSGTHSSEKESYSPDHLELLAPRNLPPIQPGDSLLDILLEGLRTNRMLLLDGDVLVVAQKVVSKAEGRTVDLQTVVPSVQAQDTARAVQKDPRLVEVILGESKRVVRQAPGVLLVEHRLGFVMANAGVDQSNTLPGHVILLPQNPDRSAANLAQGIRDRTGRQVAVIVSDSIGRAWRNGTVGHAIGVAGLVPVWDLRGMPDLLDRPLQTTEVAVADEIAAAASLLMGQAREARPAVVVRGFGNLVGNAVRGPPLLRDPAQDLFR